MPQTFSRTSQAANEIHDYLVSKNYQVESRDADGNITSNYDEAVRFTSANPAFTVHLEDGFLRFVASESLPDEVNEELATQLKTISTTYDMVWDWESLSKKLARKPGDNNVEENSMAEVMEGFGSMNGSTRTSYQALESNIKMKVVHSKPVNEEVRGSRSRNIKAIYIQRGDERFKMQENNLRAARAMMRHMAMGGEMHDEVGQAIHEMAAETRKLNQFVRYTKNSGMVNEENAEIVEMAKSSVGEYRRTLERLAGAKSYALAVENINDMKNVEITEDDNAELEAKFTQTSIDPSVLEAFGSIKRSIQRNNAYRNHIQNAIQNEDYSNLGTVLKENDFEFATPTDRLGYQVSQMASATQDTTLRNHLMGISKRITSGSGLNEFEYGTLKSCLMSASQPRTQQSISVAESVEKQYEDFISQFDIF